MTRPTRAVLKSLLVAVALSVGPWGPGTVFGQAAPEPERPPIRLHAGPHLFLDDTLIAESARLTRRVNSPRRDQEGPVVTGPEDGNFQPYLSVLRDPETGRFRIWYDVPESAKRSHLGYMESEDGIRWIRPHRVLDDPAPIRFGVSVIDEGPDFPEPRRRYKLGWYEGGGLQVAASPDGLAWTPIRPGVVLPHDHDINCIFRDPLRNRYLAMVSSYTTGDSWTGQRRIIKQSISDDLVHWEEPWVALKPSPDDEGEFQFYCMDGLLARGDLLIGMVRVLRDDLSAEPDGGPSGIGYTVLAWSHDGEHWRRDREPFFDRDPEPGTWDHAMSWIGCQLPVGDEVYLYYAGYARGHKAERFAERQLGLVRLPRDRYVSRDAGDAEGTLRTPPVVLDGEALTLNVDARGGRARAQILDTEGHPLPGFTLEDCRPITTDELAAPLRWARPLSALRGHPVRLEFVVRHARLFAFDVRD